VDGLSGTVGFEKQELRDDEVRHVIIDLGAEEDDSIQEQS
jgi:hypothetical protein